MFAPCVRRAPSSCSRQPVRPAPQPLPRPCRCIAPPCLYIVAAAAADAPPPCAAGAREPADRGGGARGHGGGAARGLLGRGGARRVRARAQSPSPSTRATWMCRARGQALPVNDARCGGVGTLGSFGGCRAPRSAPLAPPSSHHPSTRPDSRRGRARGRGVQVRVRHPAQEPAHRQRRADAAAGDRPALRHTLRQNLPCRHAPWRPAHAGVAACSTPAHTRVRARMSNTQELAHSVSEEVCVPKLLVPPNGATLRDYQMVSFFEALWPCGQAR
jgi:hypothetical protein